MKFVLLRLREGPKGKVREDQEGTSVENGEEGGKVLPKSQILFSRATSIPCNL